MDRFRTLTIALACTLAALAAGLWLGGHPGALPDGLREAFVEDDRALRAEVIDAIDDNFVREVDRKALEDASLRGMVRSLNDEFSHYFSPQETRRFEQSVSGRFEGVGMSVEQDRRGLLVLNVFEGSPAARSGIRKDDVILRVNGESIAGEDTDIATAKIKGKAGTSVMLTVLTPAGDRERTVSVRRERIEVPAARGRVVEEGGVKLGVVQLFAFSSGAHGKLRTQVDRALERGARGIALDLRGNGGGLLQEAVLVASVFVDEGLLVSTKGRTKPRREFRARGKAIAARVPMVVLVDRGSASASEIVAGALRDRGRATIVGTRTFGKGVFQEIEPLSNGGALDLTVGSYFLPSGRPVPKTGIAPDVRARDLPRTARDEALPVALRTLARKVG